ALRPRGTGRVGGRAGRRARRHREGELTLAKVREKRSLIERLPGDHVHPPGTRPSPYRLHYDRARPEVREAATQDASMNWSAAAARSGDMKTSQCVAFGMMASAWPPFGRPPPVQ